MEQTQTVAKVSNGYHPTNETKNRLRIQGTAILERENRANITAAYDYTTSCVDEFFEEDVQQLRCFELNKVALGMTIHKNENISVDHGNGFQKLNGHGKDIQFLHSNGIHKEPILTDVIWSRMDMINPSANSTAYIIKQYYKSSLATEQNSSSLVTTHAGKFNNFLCGFISCAFVIGLGYALEIISRPYSF